MSAIGLLNEKPLHSALKEWYAKSGDQFEVKVDRYVIDIVRDDLLIEIQTGSFASIKLKLNELVKEHRVRLIYPIPKEKWILKQGKDHDQKTTRRKSPKMGRVEDVFKEMVSFPHLMANQNFSLEVLLIQEEEVRYFDEKRNWRRKGWGTEERRLIEVIDSLIFNDPISLLKIIPNELEYFTSQDLVEKLGISKNLAQKMAYCLRKAGVIELIGKKGRANLYKVAGI